MSMSLQQTESWIARVMLVGGAVGALYFGFDWIREQDQDVAAMAEVAPVVEAMESMPSQIGQLSEQTSQLKRRADEAALQRRLEQERLRVLCARPDAGMPDGYCEGFDIRVRPSLRRELTPGE